MPPFSDISGPISFTRLEHNEATFVRRCDGDTDGVVINLRFDTPPKHGELKAAVLAARLPFLIDLESWRLPYLNGPDDASFGSDAETVIAKALPLPLNLAVFDDPRRIEALIRTATTAQSGAALNFAPDFQFSSLDDPWLEVNLRLLGEAQRFPSRAPLAAWVHVALETMLDGILPFAAERYAEVLPRGTYLALTVSDLRSDLPASDLASYFEALRALESRGFRVLVDRASEVSIPAVAAHATGCMIGNRIYRTAPPSPIYSSPYNPVIPLSYFDGKRARRVRRDIARKRGERKVLGCRHEPRNCRAIKANKKRNVELRLHAAHEMGESLRQARAIGSAALRSEWREAGQKHLREFAQALDLAEARSQEA